MEMLGVVQDCDELSLTLNHVECGRVRVKTSKLHTILDSLEENFKDLLVSVGPSAELRQAAQSGQIHLEDVGKIRLLQEDVQLIIQISDDLQISESIAVQYLMRAEREGSYTSEVALGLYFSDRMSVLNCLHRVLSIVAHNEGVSEPDSFMAMILMDIRPFCDTLLSPTENGHSKLVQRLMQLIKDARFQSLPVGSTSSMVYDFKGGFKPRSAMWAEEQRILCEILFLAVKVYPRVAMNSILDLFGLMMELQQRIQEASPSNSADSHVINSFLVLFSLLMTLLPQDMQQRMAAANNDERELEELAQKTQLNEILSDEPTESDPFGCLVRFAWGVLRANYRVTARAGKELVRKCSNVGVLSTLHRILSDENLKTRCRLEIHGLCLATAHSLVVHFLEIENKNIIGKVHSLYRVTRQRTVSHWNPGVTVDESQDHLCTLLDVLAEIYEYRHDLILFGQPPEAILKFIGWVPDSDLLHSSPEVLNSFVLLWSAIATGSEGAKRIHNQLYLGQKEGFHTISRGYERCQWGFIISTLIRFTMAVTGSDHVGAKQVGKDDLKGLLAYLRLIRKVLSEAPLADAAGWILDLEREYHEPLSDRKIQDVLIHLLCQSVPHELKAAINETLVAFGRTADQAQDLLKALENCTILRYKSKYEANESASNRYDLLYQLNQIEASAEDYPESLAFINLINTLMRNAHPVPDQALVVDDCTTFVVDGLLPRLGHLKFQSPIQLWKLLEACFTHLKLILENTNFNPQVVQSLSTAARSHPPGYRIIEDILGGGRVLDTICQILTRCVHDFQSKGFSNSMLRDAKHDAVIAALSVLRTVFTCDMKYIKGVEAKIRTGGMTTLDKLLLNMQREELFNLIGYVSVPLGAIQVEAISVVRHLASRRSGFMELFTAGSRYANEVIRFKEGFARALEESLQEPMAVEDLESTDPPARDLRAALVLRVLLENIPVQDVNLGHLLCGYDASHGLDSVRTSNLVERKGANCLLVILDALTPTLSIIKPQLHVNCLEVIQELVQHPASAPPLIDLLKSESYDMLLDLLQDIGNADKVFSLTQRSMGYWVVVQSQACLLDILTKGLLVLQPDTGDKDWAVCAEMLKRLFGPNEDVDSREKMVPFLSILRKLPVEMSGPSIQHFMSSEARKAFEDHGEGEGGPQEVLRAADKLRDEGGTMCKSRTGQFLYDYGLVSRKLTTWLESFIRRQSELSLDGDGFETLRNHLANGCDQICSFAMAHNGHVKLQSSIINCLEACSSAVSCMAGKRWDLLTTVCDSSGRFTSPQLFVQLATIVINMVMKSNSSQIALPLCHLLLTVITKLREEVMAKKKSITDLLLPQEGPDLLSGLVSMLQLPDARMDPQGKQLGMLGIIHFLDISKCDPLRLMFQSSKSIQENASNIIRVLNKELNNEAAGMQHHLIALQTLRQVISVDGSISIVEIILSETSLYQDITAALKNEVVAYLSPGAPGYLEDIALAQLGLILEMLSTGGPKNVHQIVQIMNSYQVIDWVCSSSVLEFLPGEWPVRNSMEMLVYSKLQKMVILILTIIERVVSGLGGSGDARKRAVDIIETCSKQFRAVLLRACSKKWGDWEPSRPDIEVATLVIELLGHIGMEHFSPSTRSYLHDTVNQVSHTFCCLTSASDSPFVTKVMIQSVQRKADLDGTAIWCIRRALISYYHKVVLYRQVNQTVNEDAVDIPTPLILHEPLQQTLLDLKDLLEERNQSMEMSESHRGTNTSLLKEYRTLLEDKVNILLVSCRTGIYSLIAWFKKSQSGGNQNGWIGDAMKFSQLLMTEVDPLVQKALEMGPRGAAGFSQIDEVWRLLKMYLEMEHQNKASPFST